MYIEHEVSDWLHLLILGRKVGHIFWRRYLVALVLLRSFHKRWKEHKSTEDAQASRLLVQYMLGFILDLHLRPQKLTLKQILTYELRYHLREWLL